MGFWSRTPPRRDRSWLQRMLSLHAAGDFDGAVALARQTLVELGAEPRADPAGLSACLNLLTRWLSDSEELASPEFRRLLERAIEVDTALKGPDHPMIAAHLRQLARSHRAAGELRKARGAIERAIGIRERAGGLSHPDLIPDLELLVVGLRDEGRPQDVVSVGKRILSIQEDASGSTSNELAVMLVRFAMALQDMPGIDLEQLESWYGQALEILAHKPRDQWPAELAEHLASNSAEEE